MSTVSSTDIKILILDDDQQVGQAIERMALTAGYEAHFTDTPHEFFERLDTWHPDFIVLDLIMPTMDGVEVIAELSNRACQAKVIISSGADQRVLEAALRSAQGHGLTIQGLLSKPFSRDDLGLLLQNATSDLSQIALDSERENRQLENSQIHMQDLAAAIKNSDIYVVVQPKIYCSDSSLAGFEALARWEHPTAGFVSPEHFVRLAEKHHLINELTWLVMNKSVEWLAELPQTVTEEPGLEGLTTRLRNISLSINISAKSLDHPTLFADFAAICVAKGVELHRIYLELTETHAMENPLASLDTLTRLRMKGFNLSIDDFGTGYSSMKQLVRLPFSEIKVDKSFVMSALESDESRNITQSIVELGNSLQLTTTAEGIEDDETLHFLKSNQCTLAQGYRISKPLPLANVSEWIISRARQYERKRLAELEALEIFGTPEEERFDRHTKMACQLFDVPYAAISLVGEHTLWFKSHSGFCLNGIDRKDSFCSHAITQRGAFIVPDTLQSVDFKDNAFVVGEPNMRFYAGYPLRGPHGNVVGTLCMVDTKPRTLSDKMIRRLQSLAHLVEHELSAGSSNNMDKLTGVLNFHGFDNTAQQALALANQLNLPTLKLSIRVSNLDAINQEQGYDVGNQALLKMANILQETLRRSDVVGRYTGATFHVLLFDNIDGHGLEVISRLKARLELHNAHSDAYALHCHIQVLHRPGEASSFSERELLSEKNRYLGMLC